jgi:hypothetical protein
VLDNLQSLPDTGQALSLLNGQLLGADLEIIDSEINRKKEFSIALGKYVRGTPLDTSVESRMYREEKINKIIGFLHRDENKKG